MYYCYLFSWDLICLHLAAMGLFVIGDGGIVKSSYAAVLLYIPY